MKKNQLILLFLFTIFCFHSGFAKSAEFASMEISPECDRDFINSYTAKKDCLVNNNGDQCVRLALFNKIGIIGTGVGAGVFVGTYLDRSLDTNPSLKTKFLDVVNEVRSSYKDFNKAVKMMEEFENEATRELSKGKYLKHDDISRATQADRNLWSEAYDKARTNFSKATLLEKDPNLKNAMEGILRSGNIEYSSKNRVLKKISEVFPEEYKKLIPYFEERKKLFDEYAKNLRLNSVDDTAQAKFDIADKLSKEKFLKVLENSNMQTKLVAELMENGWSSSYSSYARKPVFAQAKDAISKESIKGVIAKVPKFAKSVSSGIAVAVGLDSAGSYIKYQHLTYYLNSCKSRLGLSDSEINFMSNYHLIGDQNIIYQGSERAILDCDKFSFNPSEDSINDAFKNFGGVPKGICHMMIKESKSLDTLIKEKEPKISCSQNGYIETVGTGKIFGNVDMFRGGGAVAPYDKDIQWPYTQYFSNNKGFEDFNKSSPCVISPDFSDEQNQECIKMQIVSCYNTNSKRCDVVDEATKARMGSTMGSILCPKEKSSEKPPGPALK